MVAATNGITGVIAPDGTVVDRGRAAHPGRPGRATVALARRGHPRRPARALDRPGRRSSLVRPGLRAAGPVSSGAGQRRRAPDRPSPSRRAATQATDRGPHVSTTASGRVVMVIPTYNEADNLAWIVGRLRAAQPGVDVLVVDDNSPDGTGEIADELAAADPQVSVAAPHREGRPRRGVPARLPGRPRRGLRRHRRDGRRRLPPARAAAPAAGRAAGRRPGDRLALGARRLGRQLAAVAARCSPAAATSTSGCCSASRSATPPPASGCSGAPRWRRSTCDSVQSTGYVFQTDLAYRAVQRRAEGARGADRVRRAGPRRLQDERRGGHRVAASGSPCGACGSGARSCAAARREAAVR